MNTAANQTSVSAVIAAQNALAALEALKASLSKKMKTVYILFDKKIAFEEENIALEYVNRSGYNFTSFDDVCAASKRGEFAECYSITA